MNRLGTAVLAAIEGIVTVGVGIGIALVPLTLLWGFEYGLQVDWDVFWKATGSVWLVGHGVDVSFLLGSAVAKASGVSGADAPIHVTLAALGFAIVTAWLGARAGRRFAETAHRTTGVLVGTAVVAVLGLAVALSATSVATRPTVWQAVVLPALWFGIPAFAASELCRVRRMLPADPLTQRALDLVGRVPAVWRALAAFGLRAGTAATAVVVGVAGVLVALLLFTSFAEVITLYERSHAGVIGGIALTVGQLAFLPDLVGWATAWLVGPGFAIGTGSSVSPIGTALGPIPGLPVFGALPTSGHAFGLVWVLVPVVAGFAVAGALRPRLVRALGAQDSALHRALGGVAVGLVAGALTGFVAWCSSGSFGPGRLVEVGPHALVVGAVAALEVGLPAVVALAVGSDLVRLPERPWGRERWTEADEPERDGHEQDGRGTDGRGTDEHGGDVAADEGSLLAALDRAGIGRTTDVHRFVVTEEHHRGTGDDARGGRVPVAQAGTPGVDRAADETADGGDHPSDGTRSPGPTRASRPTGRDHTATDADVELPDWARTDATPVERLAGVRGGASPRDGDAPARDGVGSVRDRLRGAAKGVRGRMESLRDGADALRERAGGRRDRATESDDARARPTSAPTAPGTEAQPAFPWSTEEFVAGQHDDATGPVTGPDAAAGAADAGRDDAAVRPDRPRWDVTDQIPEDELPWWRRPGGDARS